MGARSKTFRNCHEAFEYFAESDSSFYVARSVKYMKPVPLSPQEFKRELYQKKIEMESLNHRFVCRLSPGSERPGSVSPLCDFRQRWDSLEAETVSRQVRLHSITHQYVEFNWLGLVSQTQINPSPGLRSTFHGEIPLRMFF